MDRRSIYFCYFYYFIEVEAERILRAQGLKSRRIVMKEPLANLNIPKASPKKDPAMKQHKEGVEELRQYYLTKKSMKESLKDGKELPPPESILSPPKAVLIYYIIFLDSKEESTKD